MKPIAKYLLLMLLALFAAASSAAPIFNNIVAGDASTVCSICQDTQGLVWLGTERGLMAYDGYRTIAHNTASDGTPIASRIHSMCIYRNTIWLGTEGGLMAYDVHSGQYADVKAPALKDVRAVGVQGSRLWIGCAQGLYRMDLPGGKPTAHNRQLRNIYSLLPTAGGLLVGTLDGLWLVSGSGKAHPIRIGNGRQSLVNALLADKDCVWIGTEGALYRYDWHTMQSVAALDGNSVKSLARYGDNLYVGTDNGLYIYNKVTHDISHALHDSRSSRSIANNIVWSVMADRWGNLWAGTDQGVSAVYSRPFFTFTPLADITGTGEGNCLHLISRGADGMLWLGGTNGLIGYRATRGFMPDNTDGVTWFRQTSPTHYMSHNRVRRVFTDRDGTTIVCTDHGLNIYNRQTRQMRNVIVVDPSRHYSTAWAYDIVDDGMGRYWICSYMGGVFVIGKKKLLGASAATVVADRHFLNELQGMHVWQLVKDGRGRIWARMYDRGLDRIDTRAMRVEHVVGKDRLVNDLCTDRSGNVWAAMDGEIRCFGMTARADRSLHVSGYANSDAALLCEAGGDIWGLMGQDCCIISPTGESSRFSLPGFRPLAICYDSTSGCVLLGGNDGVASIPTANVARFARKAASDGIARGGHGARPFFLLTGLLVDGKPFVPDDGYPTYLSELTLSARQNNVTFQLSDLPMAGQQPRVYAYRLEGVDRTWQYMHGDREEIGYSALPPGSYTLEVREVDGLGETTSLAYSLGVTVLPPWYLSWWAKTLYAAAALALLYWVMTFSMMRRRLREEREAKERVMQESEARSTFFDNLSRQLHRPLSGMFASVLAMLHDEKDAGSVQRLEQMRRNVADVNTLVYRAFDIQSAAAEDGSPAERVTVDLADFCRRAVEDAHRQYGRTADILYRTDSPVAYADIDVARLHPVLAELIDFAVRNRRGDGQVTVGVTTTGDKVTVAVAVPGMEISHDDMPFVFNRYFQLHGGGETTVGVNTLALVHEFAVCNGAAATVDSSDGVTTVGITFALKQTATTTARTVAETDAESRRTASVMLPDDNADTRLLAKITDTVEAHLADSDFNVTRLQETLGLGSKLLYRKVKQMTGKTPVEFIRQIRMQRAAILLREGRFAVSEVMYMVGFSNSSYFSKCFQKAYGLTPTEYARKS